MSIAQYCTKEVSLLTQDSSILEAAQMMRKNHVGEVIIVEHQKGKTIPVGIITDRDLVIEVIAMEVNIDQINLGSIMSIELITVLDGSDLDKALQIMQLHGVRRAPLVDDNGALLGLIDIESILRVLSQDMNKVLELFNTERCIEKKLRT